MLIEAAIGKPGKWNFPPFKDLKALLKGCLNETRPVNVSQKPVWDILGACFFPGQGYFSFTPPFFISNIEESPDVKSKLPRTMTHPSGMTEMETGGISCSVGVWEIPAAITKTISFQLWERGMSFESWWGRAPKTFEMFCKVQNRNLGSWEPKATFMYLSWQNGRHSLTLSSLTWSLPKYYRIISPRLCNQSK